MLEETKFDDLIQTEETQGAPIAISILKIRDDLSKLFFDLDINSKE